MTANTDHPQTASEDLQETGLLEIDRALNTIRWVNALGSDWTPQECHEVLQRMCPYLDRPFLDGSKSRHASNSALMLIWAVVGDAYRELGCISDSANAYRHACEFRPSCAYGDFYADIALRHNLIDHYEMALRALEMGAQNWVAHKIGIRVFAHIWSFSGHPVAYLRLLMHTMRRGQRIRELRRRLAAHHQINKSLPGH